MGLLGYSEQFMEVGGIPSPKVHPFELERFENEGLLSGNYALDYSNYSVFQNPFRKFPYYTACNIDGSLFKSIKRADLIKKKGDIVIFFFEKRGGVLNLYFYRKWCGFFF